MPTPHYWRNEGDGDDLSDEDGTFLLIGGMAPIERIGLPASMFSPPQEIHRNDASTEQHEVMTDFLRQITRHNDTQFRMTMDVLRQFPAIVSKTTGLVEQLGDQLGGDRDTNAQHVATVLQYQAEREQRWMEHDCAKQRHGNRSDLLARSIDIAGPDLMLMLRELFRRMKADTNESLPSQRLGLRLARLRIDLAHGLALPAGGLAHGLNEEISALAFAPRSVFVHRARDVPRARTEP